MGSHHASHEGKEKEEKFKGKSKLIVNIEDILVISGDTDSTPFDVGIFEDRGTRGSG
jgi:hypothetical protein